MTSAEKLNAKLQSLETSQLLEVVDGLKSDTSGEADTVIGAALTVLELRIPTGLYTEAEFLALCDSLA